MVFIKLKGKNATAQNMQKIIKKEGRIGSKSIDDITKLKNEGKLLEAFFSIVIRLQWQLQANFHNKFHIDWKNISSGKSSSKNAAKLWEDFTENVDNFCAIIMISYSTELITEPIFIKLNVIRILRNQIAHSLTYEEPKIFVTKNEVKSSIDECIQIFKQLEKTQTDIVFGRK